jgi:hypothetical protein
MTNDKLIVSYADLSSVDFSNNQTPKNKFLKVFGFRLNQIRKIGENRAIVINQERKRSPMP